MLPTFAVVRNPFARAVSMWAWQTCKGSTTCGRDSITASAFQLWVRQTVSVWAADAADPARWSWWYRPQADYVLGPDLECAVTHILPFERLKASYAALARLYPKLAPLPEREGAKARASVYGNFSGRRLGDVANRMRAAANRRSPVWCQYFRDDGTAAKIVASAYRVDFDFRSELYSPNLSVHCPRAGRRRLERWGEEGGESHF